MLMISKSTCHSDCGLLGAFCRTLGGTMQVSKSNILKGVPCSIFQKETQIVFGKYKCFWVPASWCFAVCRSASTEVWRRILRNRLCPVGSTDCGPQWIHNQYLCGRPEANPAPRLWIEQARKLQATLEGCNPKLWPSELLTHRGEVKSY